MPSGESTHLVSGHRRRAPSAAAAELQSNSAVSGEPVSRPPGSHHIIGAWRVERGAPARGHCCRRGRRCSRRRRPLPLSPDGALRRRKRGQQWNPRRHAMPRRSLSKTEKTVPLWRRRAPTGQQQPSLPSCDGAAERNGRTTNPAPKRCRSEALDKLCLVQITVPFANQSSKVARTRRLDLVRGNLFSNHIEYPSPFGTSSRRGHR